MIECVDCEGGGENSDVGMHASKLWEFDKKRGRVRRCIPRCTFMALAQLSRRSKGMSGGGGGSSSRRRRKTASTLGGQNNVNQFTSTQMKKLLGPSSSTAARCSSQMKLFSCMNSIFFPPALLLCPRACVWLRMRAASSTAIQNANHGTIQAIVVRCCL